MKVIIDVRHANGGVLRVLITLVELVHEASQKTLDNKQRLYLITCHL